MSGETDDSSNAQTRALTCPQCGAPLPALETGEYVTCEYCGVSSEVAKLLPALTTVATQEEDTPPPTEPSSDFEEPVNSDSNPIYLFRVVGAIIVLCVIIGAFALYQSQTTQTGSTAGDCDATIVASTTSGPAPLTVTFTANVTAAPGTSNISPEWQFGPFGTGFDWNYSYGFTVNYTWNTPGSYGVHLSVADNPGPGCYASMTVNVT
jgi:PKD repeat protein